MKTIEVKTSELEGAALDWAVAKADGRDNVNIEKCRGADAPAFCVVLISGPSGHHPQTGAKAGR